MKYSLVSEKRKSSIKITIMRVYQWETEDKRACNEQIGKIWTLKNEWWLVNLQKYMYIDK